MLRTVCSAISYFRKNISVEKRNKVATFLNFLVTTFTYFIYLRRLTEFRTDRLEIYQLIKKTYRDRRSGFGGWAYRRRIREARRSACSSLGHFTFFSILIIFWHFTGTDTHIHKEKKTRPHRTNLKDKFLKLKTMKIGKWSRSGSWSH